jgi:CHAT domain-containing protein
MGISKRKRSLLSALLVVAVSGVCFLLFRPIRALSLARLLAEAYREQRTLELRIDKTPPASFRLQRGQETSRMDRPQSLLEAETAIARGLRSKPDDSSLLTARGQADLMEWSYEAAITDMQEALDAQPGSAAVLNGLASAYFERAESEDRFNDYGTAFELQSRALDQSSDDQIILFNRAITSSRLYLYKQSIQDWQRYLLLDPSGGWSDEARQRLGEVRRIVDAHERRTKTALLGPAEFVRTVDSTDSRTWDRVEPRIEEYLSTAITDWLPAAFPEGDRLAPSAEANHALGTLAIILDKNHGDRWLKDLLLESDSRSFVRAVRALATAVEADNAAQNYVLGRSESARAAGLFSQSGNFSGQMRAQFEEVYALHFSDAALECLEKSRNMAPQLARTRYRWLRVQLQLEQSVCYGMNGDLGDASELTANAYSKAVAAGYPSLSLRAAGFRAADLGEKGQQREAWKLCREGLGQYWAGSTRPVPGYNLYIFMDQLAEESEPWFFATAIDEQALALLPVNEYPVWGAFEHSRLAKAAARAHMVHVAHESLLAADRLFALAPKTEITENVRFGTEIEVAELSAEADSGRAVLKRLQSMNQRLETISNFYVASDYFRAIGKLESATGQFPASEEAFEESVAMMEEQRSSLRSEDDRSAWNQRSVESYRALVEAKLRMGDSFAALTVWEMYRDEPLRESSAKLPSFSAAHVATQVQQLRNLLAVEANQLSRVSSSLGRSTALVYVSVSTGIYLWRYDKEGVRGKLIERDPVYVRMLANRFGELCAAPTSPSAPIQAIARQLYDMLLAPVAEELSPGQPVIIETDGALSAVPFQALSDSNGRYLSDMHPLVYSAGLWDLAGPEPGWPESLTGMDALVVASGGAGADIGLRPLSDAIAEAHDVALHLPRSQELIGDQASLSSVVKALPHAAAFHFAGHAGMLNGRIGLLLPSSDLRRETTVLDSAALDRISVPNLRMVVLSACSTENGTENRMLAPQSLARSFLRAGVRHVVATRWNVDSVAGRMLVRVFYEGLISGQSVSGALALAQTRVRQIAPHPYYWAGFDAFGSP